MSDSTAGFEHAWAIPAPRRTAAANISARSMTIASVAAQCATGAMLLAAVHVLDGNQLRLGAVAIASALLLVRAALGMARSGWCGALAFGLITTSQLLLLAASFDDDATLRLRVALVGLAVVPFVLGTVPAIALVGIDQGRRRDVTPALVASALCGALGVLAAITAVNVVDVPDARLAALMPYAAVAAALLAMCEVMAQHRAGAGFCGSVAIVLTAAVGVHALLLVNGTSAPADAAVTAAAVASGIAAVGLLVTTALATPRPLVIPVAEAGDGPRFIGWEMAALVMLAVVARLVVRRPLWLDDAEVARITQGSLRDTLDAARAAHAHPPLLDVLVWASRQVFGSSDIALRLPSIVAGVLLVPAVYVAAEKLYDRRVAVIAAALVAIAPGLLWLSDGSQPGALAALLAALALITLLNATQIDRFTDWMLLGAAGVALLWTHQLAVMHLTALHVAAAVALWRRRRRGERTLHFAAGWTVALAMTLAGLAALLVHRHGFGPPDVLPPYEYATTGAPGAGRSVFGLAGSALAGLLGFHPEDITSRLLALWPMCILATFVFFGRAWSGRGALLVTLGLVPFVTLLVLQIAGAPRNPPFALAWIATAIPMLAIGAGRAISLIGRWRSARFLGLCALCVMVAAAVDQYARVDTIDRFDVGPAIDQVGTAADEHDLVVYAPGLIGDLVRHEVPDAEVIAASDASQTRLARASDIHIVGAFAMDSEDPSLEAALALVHEISGDRQLVSEYEHGETKVWTFD